MNLGELENKARQIVSVCKEELADHRFRIHQLELKHKVKFEYDGESMIMICKKHKEEEECYAFDQDEWLDGEPNSKELKNLNMEYADSFERMVRAVETRCKVEIDQDEFQTTFIWESRTEQVRLIGNYNETDWRNLQVEIKRRVKA